MEQEQLTIDSLIDQNMNLNKELWQIKAHLAQREVYIIELNQHILNLSRQNNTEIKVIEEEDTHE